MRLQINTIGNPGWQFNRLFIGPSFGPKIVLSFGPTAKLKRPSEQTAQVDIVLSAQINGPRIGLSFGPRFVRSIELPDD